jgi:PKD repeat protein
VTDNANGELQQWEVFDNGSGLVDAAKVRTIQVGSHSEGLVADDIHKYLYVSQEDVAIWKYGAEPGDGSSRTQVDAVTNGRLEDDIEGLTIYYASNGNGYLIASSQGSKDYVIYQRAGNNPYVMTFAIVPGNGVDGTNETDGIDVINFPLGTAFPFGVFLAQDGTNDDGNQNFKLVPWQAIANAVSPALTIDTTWDPRQIGGSSCEVNAEFHATTISGCTPLAVNFTDQSTPQSGVTSWAWNFGDGAASAAQNPSHTFTTAGTYTVQLTVNSTTCSNTEIKTGYINVSSIPAAAFTGLPNSGGAPLTINFTDQSTGVPAAWLWDFGDGSSSTLKNPSHQYDTPGTYTVTLTVTNACGGDGEIKTDYITVSNCAPGNVARGKSATASSVRSGYPPSYAVDGNTSTKWKSNSGGVQWLEVDLGSPHETDDAVIRWDGSNRAKDFEFQYWDGASWVKLFGQANNSNSTSTINFAATCAQKFRVYMTKPNSSRYYIKELEINGCPCATVSKSSLEQAAPPLNQIPNEIILQPNYPNPFNPRTNINFTLPQAAPVMLKVYNLAGAEVATLVNGRREAGAHTVVFDAANLPSGVYFSILQVQEVRQVPRLLLMK